MKTFARQLLADTRWYYASYFCIVWQGMVLAWSIPRLSRTAAVLAVHN